MALHSWCTRFFENVNIEKIERIRGDSAPNRMKDLAGESKRDQLKRIPLRSIGMKCCFKVPFIPVTRTAPERLGRISFLLTNDSTRGVLLRGSILFDTIEKVTFTREYYH